MNRRSVIRCILGVAAAPKILAELDFKPPIVTESGATKTLFSELQLLTPQYINGMVAKYGNGNWIELMESKIWNEERPQYFWFESNKKSIS